MKRVLCLAIGHQRQPMPFSSTRFACRRCGLALEPTAPAWPPSTEVRARRDVLRGDAVEDVPAPGSQRAPAGAITRRRSLSGRSRQWPGRVAYLRR
jgi:hypothetical protein